jgi:hypothetical protein
MVLSPLKLTLVIVATALVAAAAGYVGAAYRLSSLNAIFFNSSFLSSASNAAIDVHTLRAIRAGDLAKATSSLEARIDMSLLHLAVYDAVVPPELREASVYDDLATVRAYRSEVPSSNPSAEVQADIKRALNLRPPTKGQR